MGNCGNYRIISEFETQLRPVKPSSVDSGYTDQNDKWYKDYDDFYLRASQLLQDIKSEIEDIDRAQKSFIEQTQIRNQNIHIGYVLLSFVVAIAAENDCDLTPFDIQFDPKFPGILLKREELSDENRDLYETWEKWSQNLGTSIRRMNKFIKDIPLFYEYSKRVADEILKLAYDHNIPISVFRQQEVEILNNEEMISKAHHNLQFLIDSTHSAIYESTEMLDKMHLEPQLMAGVLEIAAKANKTKTFTAHEVLKKYREDIEKMVESSETKK